MKGWPHSCKFETVFRVVRSAQWNVTLLFVRNLTSYGPAAIDCTRYQSRTLSRTVLALFKPIRYVPAGCHCARFVQAEKVVTDPLMRMFSLNQYTCCWYFKCIAYACRERIGPVKCFLPKSNKTTVKDSSQISLGVAQTMYTWQQPSRQLLFKWTHSALWRHFRFLSC